jgi:hypothetical protein
VIGWVFYFN